MLSLATPDLTIVVPLLLIVIGPALHIYCPLHEMNVEERVKDGDLSEAEARRQMRFYRLGATCTTALGLTLLTVSFYDSSG